MLDRWVIAYEFVENVITNMERRENKSNAAAMQYIRRIEKRTTTSRLQDIASLYSDPALSLAAACLQHEQCMGKMRFVRLLGLGRLNI